MLTWHKRLKVSYFLSKHPNQPVNCFGRVVLCVFQSIFSQLKLSPNLKKVLFATALGSVALALTAHQMKRRGRKRKQVTQSKDVQKNGAGMLEMPMRTGRTSSLKRGGPSKEDLVRGWVV